MNKNIGHRGRSLKTLIYRSLILLWLMLLSVAVIAFCAEKRSTPLVCNLTYSISSEPPSLVDYELVENVDTVFKKPFLQFGKNLQKKHSLKIITDESQKKLPLCNSEINLQNIHAEYNKSTYSNDYTASVQLTLILKTPENLENFKKIYSSTSKMHLGPQWPEWIGIQKVTRYAIGKTLQQVLEDTELKEALKGIDKTIFFNDFARPDTAEIKGSQQTLSIEERLKTLNSLKEKGLITEEEYQKKKQEILNQL